MKKVIVTLSMIMAVTLAGCKISGEHSIGSRTSEKYSLQKQTDEYTDETRTVLSLPSEYAQYDRMISVDDEWYYFCNDDDLRKWKFL